MALQNGWHLILPHPFKHRPGWMMQSGGNKNPFYGPLVGKLSDRERDWLISWEEKVVINKAANHHCLTGPSTHLVIEEGPSVSLTCRFRWSVCPVALGVWHKPMLDQWHPLCWRHRDRGDRPAGDWNLKFPFRARVSWLPAVMLEEMGS